MKRSSKAWPPMLLALIVGSGLTACGLISVGDFGGLVPYEREAGVSEAGAGGSGGVGAAGGGAGGSSGSAGERDEIGEAGASGEAGSSAAPDSGGPVQIIAPQFTTLGSGAASQVGVSVQGNFSWYDSNSGADATRGLVVRGVFQ